MSRSLRLPTASITDTVPAMKEPEAGMATAEVCRRHGISPATFYQWKSKYGGMSASDLKRLRDLEAENARLKKMYAEERLKADILKEAMAKKW